MNEILWFQFTFLDNSTKHSTHQVRWEVLKLRFARTRNLGQTHAAGLSAERTVPQANGDRSEARAPVAVERLRDRCTCSVEEAAALLGIGRSTAYAAARDGSLPTLRLSHRLLVPTAKLLEMIGCDGEQVDQHGE